MKPSVLLAAFLLAFAGAVRAADAVFSLKAASPEVRASVEKYRGELQVLGFRFDEDDDHLLSPNTHAPVSSRELELYLHGLQTARVRLAIEKLRDLLKGLDPDKPVPADVAAQIEAVVRDTPGFPSDVAKVLAGARVDKAGALRAAALSSYLEMTGQVEGETTWRQRFDAARGVEGGGWSRPPTIKSYQTDAERALGERVARATVDYFNKYKTGAELMDHFRDARGDVKLPDMLVLKITDFANAFYSSADRAMFFNFPQVRDSLVGRLPLEKRQALRDSLKSPKDINDYLAKDPGAIQSFIEAQDVIIFHELTHAWQDKRQKLWVEMNRGNAPGVDPLECEWEAFINQNRFIHDKLLKDPAEGMRSPQFENYKLMLANYDQFQDGITRRYLELMPTNAATLPEMRSMQGNRVGATRTLMGTDLVSVFRGALRLLGLSQGSSALREAQTDFQERRDAFKKGELPRMRVEGGFAMAKAYDAQGDWAQALSTILVAEKHADDAPASKRDVSVLADRLARRAYDEALKGSGDANARGAAVDALVLRYSTLKRGPEISLEMQVGAYLDVAADSLKRLELATDPTARAQLAANAKAWVAAFDSLDPAKLKDPRLAERLKALRFEVGGMRP